MERRRRANGAARALALILWPALAVAQPQPSPSLAWKKISDHGGMLIEARPVPGTAVRELRTQLHSGLPPQAIFAVIWNVAEQPEFVPNLKVLRVLRQSEDEIVIYERLKVPVVADRDYVMRLRKKIDGETGVYEVFTEGLSEPGPPPVKGVVRMTRLSSSFTLRPGKDGGCELTYVSFGDPAGSVPAWIVRASEVRGPREFLRAILKRAEQNTAKK